MVKKKLLYILLTACLCTAFIGSLSNGAVPVPPADVVRIFLQKLGLWKEHAVDETFIGVIEVIRLPRTLLSVLVGAALGISGAAIQAVFRNPLAEPGLVGISAGASLMAAAVIALETALFAGLSSLLGHYLLAFAAFAGAGLAVWLVYLIADTDGKPNVATMLLAGIAINALAGALTGLISYLADEQQLRTITFWMLGSLAGATWEAVWCVCPFVLAAVFLLPRLAKALNSFALGEGQTQQLGLRPDRVKIRVVVLVTLSVGVAVSVSGMIGFVGLLVPHALRLLAGPDNRFVLPASALLGGLTLCVADLIARSIVAPLELPLGVITALMGTPVFLYILIRDKKKITAIT